MENAYVGILSKRYKISKAALHIRKAKAILEDIEVDNSKVQGDFAGILNYCNSLIGGNCEINIKDNNQENGKKEIN